MAGGGVKGIFVEKALYLGSGSLSVSSERKSAGTESGSRDRAIFTLFHRIFHNGRALHGRLAVHREAVSTITEKRRTACQQQQLNDTK